MMHAIGFTGTRNDIPSAQAEALSRVLKDCPPHSELHHGDCVGADVLAHMLAKALGWRVVAHPALIAPELRANMQADEIRQPLAPLERNVDIVEETTRLIACPAGPREEIRSGTWQTIRAARKAHRPITIIWPSGQSEDEQP